MLGAPPWFVGDYEDAHYANMEASDGQFVKYTLIPWVARIEEEINYKCFSAAERNTGLRFNLSGFLRGDTEKRGEFYSKMWNIGAFSHNDILKLEDMNTYEGGERRYIPLNYVPVDKVDENLANKATPPPLNGQRHHANANN